MTGLKRVAEVGCLPSKPGSLQWGKKGRDGGRPAAMIITI